MPKEELPVGLAILVCEFVITDELSKNKTIVGTFNQITSASFPCVHPRICLFVALTNGSGSKAVSLVLKREGGSNVLSMGGQVPFDNPNCVVELTFNIKNCLFAEAGPYTFEVRVDNEFIFDRRFEVVESKQQNE